MFHMKQSEALIHTNLHEVEEYYNFLIIASNCSPNPIVYP